MPIWYVNLGTEYKFTKRLVLCVNMDISVSNSGYQTLFVYELQIHGGIAGQGREMGTMFPDDGTYHRIETTNAVVLSSMTAMEVF